MSQSIAIVIVYFGTWPPWINFFIESCRSNPDIDWYIFTNCSRPENVATNVSIMTTSFEEYKKRVSETLRIPFDPHDSYKLCDIRPAFGVIHGELLTNYDFFGFGDLDVIYGNIRRFYDTDVLNAHSVFSTHIERLSGHFFLMRNCPQLVNAFRSVPHWDRLLSRGDHVHFDEVHFTKAIKRLEALSGTEAGVPIRTMFQERYSSPDPCHGMRWYWKDGDLTNEFYRHAMPHRGFLYLHFAAWHSSRHYMWYETVSAGSKAPWEGGADVVKLDWRRARTEGFMISPQGFEKIQLPVYSG